MTMTFEREIVLTVQFVLVYGWLSTRTRAKQKKERNDILFSKKDSYTIALKDRKKDALGSVDQEKISVRKQHFNR